MITALFANYNFWGYAPHRTRIIVKAQQYPEINISNNDSININGLT